MSFEEQYVFFGGTLAYDKTDEEKKQLQLQKQTEDVRTHPMLSYLPSHLDHGPKYPSLLEFESNRHDSIEYRLLEEC